MSPELLAITKPHKVQILKTGAEPSFTTKIEKRKTPQRNYFGKESAFNWQAWQTILEAFAATEFYMFSGRWNLSDNSGNDSSPIIRVLLMAVLVLPSHQQQNDDGAGVSPWNTGHLSPFDTAVYPRDILLNDTQLFVMMISKVQITPKYLKCSLKKFLWPVKFSYL
jgi:hypothetical protein